MALDPQRAPAMFSNHLQWLERFFRHLHVKLAPGWISMVDQRHRLMILKGGGRIEGKGESIAKL